MDNILIRNNVKIIGEGTKTIVFGHGFGCDQNVWNFITPYFISEYKIVLFDYVGSGNSDLKAYDINRYKNLFGYAEDLLEVLGVLKSDPVIFVGHSVSSMIGLLASLKKPEYFQALVMIGPSPRYINDLPQYYGGFSENDVKELLKMMEMNYTGWASLNAANFMNNPERPILGKKLEEIFTAENPVIMSNFARATFLSDHRGDLMKTTLPCLIVQCSEDSIVPVEVAEYLHKNIKNSELEIIEVKGHYPHISEPIVTSDLIKRYVSSLELNK